MTHRDVTHCKARFNFEYLRSALEFLLGGSQWGMISWRTDCGWKSPRLLTVVSLLWAWSSEETMVDRLSVSKRIASAMYPQLQVPASSFQAFCKLLQRWSGILAAELKATLHRRMTEQFADLMRIGKFNLMAVDGSRIGLPRTLSNENEFSSKRHPRKSKKKKHRSLSAEKKANTVSMWLTTLWHCGTGLPWDWRLGPSDSSERAHWLEMLAELSSPTLFVGDAGFVGYEYAKAVMAAGHALLIRVGSNVTLIKKLGYAQESQGIVYLWPSKAAKRSEPPIVLRLVVCNNGRHPVYLLTSVLSVRELSDTQVIKAYKRRWGIELFYRHLKRTYGKHKLVSRSSKAAYVEMTWAFLGLWCMALYSLKQLHAQGIHPARLSFAKLIRAFRRMMRDFALPAEKNCKLCDLLKQAVIDEYHRTNKASRDYPRKKNERPPGPPRLRAASTSQINQARKLAQKKHAKIRLTA